MGVLRGIDREDFTNDLEGLDINLGNHLVFYETFKRESVRIEDPAIAVTPRGRIAINAAATRLFEKAGVKTVTILWDKTTGGIALQAAPKGNKDSYSLSFADGYSSATLAAKTFLRHIGWSSDVRQVVTATWDAQQKMLEAKLPSQCVGRVDQNAAAKPRKPKK